MFVWDQQRTLWSDKFLSQVQRDMSFLEARLEINEQVLLGVRSFFQASNYVDLQEFKTYVGPIIKEYKFIQALEWIPRVPAAERQAYEERMQKEGFPDFEFTDRLKQGEMGRAGSREEYFPVYYVEPIKGNEKAIGFDLASNSIRLKSLEESRDSGKPLATDKITLVQEKQSQAGVLIFAPFYGKGFVPETLMERRDSLKGFILGVYRVGDMMEKIIIPLLGKGMNLAIFAGDKISDKNKLYGNIIEDAPLQINKQINFSGRQWTIIWQASSDFMNGFNGHFAIYGGSVVFLAFL